MLPTLLHHRTRWTSLSSHVWRNGNVCIDSHLHRTARSRTYTIDTMGFHRHHLCFLFVFGYAWQGCVWLYCSEIAPLEYRHIGGAATAFGEWLMTFITVFAGPIGLTNIGWKFWIWVLSGNVVAIFFV